MAMNTRGWMLVGLLAVLSLGYAWFFTEWLRPAPIEIASQIRFVIQPPRFGRPVKTPVQPGQPGQPAQPGQPGTPGQGGPPKLLAPTNRLVQALPPIERIGQPDKGVIDPAPGGAANVTFSLDSIYQLTRLRVEDLPADGTPPKIVWEATGKSRPTRSLLYGRVPAGMKPAGTATNAEPLMAGVPYRLIVEAGRRRGTNRFTTTALVPQ